MIKEKIKELKAEVYDIISQIEVTQSQYKNFIEQKQKDLQKVNEEINRLHLEAQKQNEEKPVKASTQEQAGQASGSEVPSAGTL